MLLRADKIKKEYGVQAVLDIEHLEIWDGERIGLVGINGSGKSTLLKILAGEAGPDEGQVERFCEIAMISQNGETTGEATEFYQSQMGIRKKEINSGGEKTRLAIAAAYSCQAPLLFADEPTTNLDQEGLEKLEEMMFNYPGAVVLISHDRSLLDQVCTTIWSLEAGKIRVYPGNYSEWLEQRQKEHQFIEDEYQQYQKDKKRIRQMVVQSSQKAKTMTKAPKRMGNSEARLHKNSIKEKRKKIDDKTKIFKTRLENLAEKERPLELPEIKMTLGNFKTVKSKYAVKMKDLTIQFGEHLIIDRQEIEIPAGQCSFLKGANGSGKTSLIKRILAGGDGVTLASDLKVGYVSQQHDTLDWNKTVLENVRYHSILTESVDRAVLANLNLSKEDINKKISVLSGGERVKAALAQVLVSECNMLILDEPTNHMDVYAIEALEALLKKWQGTLFLVSHDRTFTENLAERIFLIEDKKIISIK